MEKLTDELLNRYALGFLEDQIAKLCKCIVGCPVACNAASADRLLELLLQRKDLLDRKKSNAQSIAAPTSLPPNFGAGRGGTVAEIAEDMKK